MALNVSLGSTSGVEHARAVTPADGSDLPDGTCRGLTASGAGNVSVIFAGDTAAVTVALNAGVAYPYIVKRVRSTNTTATGIVALY